MRIFLLALLIASIFLLGALIPYGFFSFVEWGFSIPAWSVFGRFMFAVMLIVWGGFLGLLTYAIADGD